VPRAGIKTILISELAGPFITAVLMIIAYTFVKSLSTTPINSLLRLAVVALGPIVWNLVILVAVFFISLFLGPMLGGAGSKFPSVMAAISHTLAVVGYVG
jgi:1,3-beta-glucan synthase